MHRTTTAALLITVATSAVSGCVSVDRPAPGQAIAPTVSPAAAPSAERGSSTRAVEGPANEALRRMGPAAGSEPPAERARPTRRGGSGPQPPKDGATGDSPAPGGRRSPQPPPVVGELPGRVLPSAPAVGAELCKLGRDYGGWHPDSPQARICADAARR